MPRDNQTDNNQTDQSASGGEHALRHALHAAAVWPRSAGHPVFSVPWLRRRLFLFCLVGVLVALPTFVASLTEIDDWRAIVIATILIPLPLLTYPAIGPSLATWIRSRRLARRRETAALAAAIAFGIGAAWTLDHGIDRGLRMALYGDADMQLGFETTAGVFIHKRGEDIHTSSKPPEADDMRKRLHERFGTLVDIANGAMIFTLMLWFGGGFSLAVFFRQRRELEEAAQQEALARANAARNEAELKLSVLAAQVEPHFLFNTLAGVRSAITSDPERAVAIVDHLADYLRASIPRLRSDGMLADSTIASQVAFVRAYLGVMHARMPRLSFDIECPLELAAMPMPPLLLIPLVENAVRHGVEPKVGPGHVLVRIECRPSGAGEGTRGELVATVEDDGVGFGGTTSGSGIGLVNIRERLAMLYGDAAALSLAARPEGGVRACIRIPLGDNIAQTSMPRRAATDTPGETIHERLYRHHR